MKRIKLSSPKKIIETALTLITLSLTFSFLSKALFSAQIIEKILIIVSIIGVSGLIIYNYSQRPSEKIKHQKEIKQNNKKNIIGYKSDVGKVRKLDEDSLLFMNYQSGESGASSKKVMILGDGMGGHSKGELASFLAIRTTYEHITNSITNKNDTNYSQILIDAFRIANNKVYNYSKQSPDYQGMGTTLTACILEGTQLNLGHVGDTRLYVLNDNNIKQITKDHSLVQEYLDKGQITPEEARVHPQRNVITRVIGVYPEVEGQISTYQLRPNDRLLLCCDGLHGYLSEREMFKLTCESFDPQEACEKMVDMANNRGGSDNITVVLTPKNWLN